MAEKGNYSGSGRGVGIGGKAEVIGKMREIYVKPVEWDPRAGHSNAGELYPLKQRAP